MGTAVFWWVDRAPKKHISKKEDRDVPYKSPYNDAQYGRDIPLKCLCLCAFWVPKLRASGGGRAGLGCLGPALGLRAEGFLVTWLRVSGEGAFRVWGVGG